MKSIGRRLLSSVCALAMAANGLVVVMAQDRKSDGKAVAVQTGAELIAAVNITAFDPTGGALRIPEGFNSGLNNSAQQGGDSAFQFFSQEMSFDNRLVKGAPFSADVVTETIQTLPDGNRIVQRVEGRIYRDSQGRARNERTFQMGGTSEQKQTISIFDPVGGVSYTLDPETRTARKTNSYIRGTPPLPPPTSVSPSASANAEAPKKITVSGGVLQGSAIRRVQPPYPPVAKAARAEGAVQIQVLVSETGEVIEATVVSGHPLLRDAALQAARQWQFKPTELGGRAVKVQGILTFNFTMGDSPTPSDDPTRRITKYTTNTEQLGKQTIEGVECEGTRAVTAMPAGAIGNERPIETVNETWYSPELRMMILTKRDDPRFGESTYRVTNVSRSEPDASLFQVPSDYTVKESGFGGGAFGVPGRVEGGDIKRIEEMRRKIEETRKPNNQ